MKKIIALAGAPNCGKTTLFNLITKTHGAVGNRPGVTVEKKEGKLKGNKDVIGGGIIIQDNNELSQYADTPAFRIKDYNNRWRYS